jgi:hypothetical protein
MSSQTIKNELNFERMSHPMPTAAGQNRKLKVFIPMMDPKAPKRLWTI